MSAEANKEAIRGFFETLNRGDPEEIVDWYADDLEYWTAGDLPFSGTHDKAALRELAKGILGAFPDGIRFSITGMTAERDRVAVEAEAHGLHSSGNRYENRYHFLFVLRDGKIRSAKEYMDTQHAAEVLVGHGEA